MSILLAISIGVAAGIVGGMFGVGGGILFVPALALVIGLAQVEAEATSLLAMVPVALAGAYRQGRYGNLRLREGVFVGLVSVPGVVLGAVFANYLTNRQLEIGFGCLLIVIALLVARRALKGKPPV